MAQSGRGFGYWAAIALAVVMALFGIPIFAGGVWLITLGGSWYYIIAGLGLLVSAWFLFRNSMLAVWVYLATFAFTLIWALWERGFDGWAQAPRLVAPTVILVLVLLTRPALRGRFTGGRASFTAAAVGIVALGLAAVMLTSVQQSSVLFAQETQAPTEPAPAETVAPTAPTPATAAEPAVAAAE